MLSVMQPSLKGLNAEKLIIKFPDGLPIDETEVIENTIRQVNAGILSKLSAIKAVNEVDEAAATIELERVNAEASAAADIEARASSPVIV